MVGLVMTGWINSYYHYWPGQWQGEPCRPSLPADVPRLHL